MYGDSRLFDDGEVFSGGGLFNDSGVFGGGGLHGDVELFGRGGHGLFSGWSKLLFGGGGLL